MDASGYADRSKSLRAGRGLAQGQLAERLGVTFATADTDSNTESELGAKCASRVLELRFGAGPAQEDRAAFVRAVSPRKKTKNRLTDRRAKIKSSGVVVL